MIRDFNEWLTSFRDSISDYGFYIDFETVYKNIKPIKFELNLINSLVGEKNIEEKFKELVLKYPDVLKVVPILLAKREYDIFAMDEKTELIYDFLKPNVSINEYCYFMNKTGLFDLLANRLVSNVYDYVVGVEVGLNSNGRKNRGGHLMEDIVESHLIELGLIKGKDYEKEYSISSIENRLGINLSEISNQGTTVKRFDFVIFVKNHVYAIETNFYSSGGSKLNETARSYEMLARKSKNIENFTFIWITDGKGWFSAKNNLKETFDVLDTLYNISDLKKNCLTKILGIGNQ